MTTLTERFWAKVRTDPGPESCWLWTGGIQSNGYGVFRFEGVLMLAHRVAWRFAHGRPAPVDKEIAHTCDVRACVRPSHLFVATHTDNMRDAAQKGRLANRRQFRDERGRYTGAAA